MKKAKKLIFAVAVLGSLSVASSASAQLGSNTPVDQLETEMDKLTDVYDDLVPVAIGAAAFSVGMILVKRIAFS